MLIKEVDAVVIRVPSVKEGLSFYRDKLGHSLLWRKADAAGLAMASSGTELVLATGLDQQTDLLVDSVETAAQAFVAAGGSVVSSPADIPVGRVVVVADPFGNGLVLLDLSKGRYVTDSEGNVTGLR